MEDLDPWPSRAFAVADHQIAHVYVRRPEDLADRASLRDLPGVAEVLDDEGKKAHGLDHPRSGELVAVAEPDAWFTYYYWLDDARAPTSPDSSRSTASPATTPPNSSSTRRRRPPPKIDGW